MFRRSLTAQLAAPALLASLVGIGAIEVAGWMDWNLFAAGALASLAVVVVVVHRAHRLTLRLQETVDLLERVGDGHLDVSISIDESDELGAMKTALGIAIQRMRGDLESLHQHRVLTDSLRLGLLLVDPDGCVLSANPAARNLVDRLGAEGMPCSGEIESAHVSFLFGGRPCMDARLADRDTPEHFSGIVGLERESLRVSMDAIQGLDGVERGHLVTFEIVTEEQENASRLRESIETERETADRLRDAIERERARAESEAEVATEMRLKADRISGVVVAAAGGDLTQRIRLMGDSPLDQIAVDLDAFLDDLAARIMQVREVATELGATGRELDGVGKSLVSGARRTTEEVASVARAWRDTGEGVDAIGSRVGQLAESYASIAASASVAARDISSGVQAAVAARGSIEELDRSTEEIQIILTVIDQIADQSKLLALNASIEAARAGESGRGFNVVAQEVKKLASRTEDATREIARTVAEILERGDRSRASIHAMTEVMDRVDTNQSMITETMVEQQDAAGGAQELVAQVHARSADVAASIDQLSRVAESSETDAAGTDREAHKLFELAHQIGELTSRFFC